MDAAADRWPSDAVLAAQHHHQQHRWLPVFHPLSVARLLLDLIMSACALASAVLAPMWWAFYLYTYEEWSDRPQPLDGSLNDGWSWLVGTVFVLAPFANMRTALRWQGQLYSHPADIRRIYFRSYLFAIDVVSFCAGPLHLVQPAFGWLAIVRICYVQQFLSKLESSTWLSKNLVRAVLVALIFFMSVHWVACVWVALAHDQSPSDPTWYTWVLSEKHETALSPEIAYLWATYWTLTTVSTCGFGDITVVTQREAIFMTILLVSSVMLYSSLIANMSSFFINSDAAYTQHRVRVETAKVFMRHNHFPHRVQLRVLAYLDYLWSSTMGINEAEIYAVLPETLQQEMRLSADDKIIQAIPLFKDCQKNVISEIVGLLVQRTYLPGDMLIEKGDDSHEMYIIKRGVVEIIGAAECGASVFISAGNHFGDVGAVLGCKRSHSVRAYTHTVVYLLRRTVLNAILVKYPACIDNLIESMAGLPQWKALQTELQNRCSGRSALAFDASSVGGQSGATETATAPPAEN